MNSARTLAVALLCIVPVTIAGCDPGGAKLQADQKHFHEVIQNETDAAQWRLDEATARRLFDDNTQAGLSRYTTFIKCHAEPPSQDSNKRLCVALQAQLAKREAKDEAREGREKAAW